MAGDWIPMRLDLREDPAVIRMAEILGTDEDHVVGLCHRLWSWVSRNSNAAALQDVTQPVMARAVNSVDFVSAMVQVGWILIVDNHVEIPHYDRWLSQSAKRRALASKRQAEFRNKQRNASVTQRALPQKRREEKRCISPNGDIQGTHARPAFTPPSLGDVQDYIAQRKSPVDAEAFHAFYTANGWKQSRGKPIVNWHACVTTWEKNAHQFSSGKTRPTIPEDF